MKKKYFVFALVAIALVVVAMSGMTESLAWFSDTEVSQGNNLQAGYLNLQVGSEDPTAWNFTVEDMVPGGNFNHDVAIQNTGNVPGDLSVEVSLTNMLENLNPEAETNTAGLGELQDQVKIVIYMMEDASAGGGFDNAGVIGYASDLNGQTFDIPDHMDDWVNDPATDTRLRVRTWFVEGPNNNSAMNDSFDLNLTFNLVQK